MVDLSHSPLSGGKRVLGTLVLAFGNFMIVLDTTIANVSIPTIAGDLGISTTEGTWVITSYAVAEAITVPLTSWLAMRFGQVRLFVASVAAFVLFSVLCGLAWSLESLVVFRIAQGLTGGPVTPLSAILLLSIFPKDKSHIALALWGMTTVIAPIGGPLIGGWICDNYTWPWIFYINVPFGLFIGLGAWGLLRNRETEIRRTPIDGVGVGLLVVFVTAFQLMLDKGRELDWFASSFILGCAIVSVLALAALIIWELTDDDPVLDLSVFASRNWVVSTLTLCLMFGLFFGNIVLTPIWLQSQMGYTAYWSGLAIAPLGVFAVVTAPIVGLLLPKIDPRLIVTYGMSVLALSFFMRAQFTTQVDYLTIALPMLILGAGVPACIVTLTALGVSDLPPEKVAGGSSMQNFLRVMSMAVGGSLAQTYWEHATKENRAELVSIIDPAAQARLTEQAMQMGLPEPSAVAFFSRTVDGQAVMLATNDFYAGACLLMLAFAGVIWFARRPKGSLQQSSGH